MFRLTVSNCSAGCVCVLVVYRNRVCERERESVHGVEFPRTVATTIIRVLPVYLCAQALVCGPLLQCIATGLELSMWFDDTHKLEAGRCRGRTLLQHRPVCHTEAPAPVAPRGTAQLVVHMCAQVFGVEIRPFMFN